MMEVTHQRPKQLKWDSSKPKAQTITSGEEQPVVQNKGKGQRER